MRVPRWRWWWGFHRETRIRSRWVEVWKEVFRKGYMEGPVTVIIWKMWVWMKRRAGSQDR